MAKTKEKTSKSKSQSDKPSAKGAGKAEKVKALHFAMQQGRAAGETAIDVSAFEDLGLDEMGGAGLMSDERHLLGKVGRFLFTITAPKLLRRAVGAGYTRAEHDELWRLFTAAAGRLRSLESHFRAAGDDSSGQRQELLVALDTFENTWFPRTRMVILRRVPADSAEQFAEVFFRDLSQQPLGPLVVDSVSTFLDRFDALATSTEPGAADVHATLQGRGLTEEAVSEMRRTVSRARAGVPNTRSAPDSTQERQDTEVQQTALRGLRLAWNDWGTTLRPLFDVREQVQLGLTELKVRALAAAPTDAGLPPNAPTAEATKALSESTS